MSDLYDINLCKFWSVY